MDATFMNSAKSETSDCHRLSFSLTDKKNLPLFGGGGPNPPPPPPPLFRPSLPLFPF